jgi:hypothetical protein
LFNAPSAIIGRAPSHYNQIALIKAKNSLALFIAGKYFEFGGAKGSVEEAKICLS